ncbi:MAG: hypothetical protein H7Z42_05065, partial [Roseiflexaceae bacterium]|nr:hypothetical protein [Roseiflexaceae bacterium]
LARAIVRAARRRVAAGIDPMLMRRGIEQAVAASRSALDAQARPAKGQETLTRLATGITGDPELGRVLGEMFDVLGADAALQIDEFAAPYLDREYLDGGRWRGRPATRTMMPEGGSTITLSNPLIVVAQQKLDQVAHVRAALELAAAQPQRPPVLIVASEIGGEALDTLALNYNRGAANLAAAVLTGGASNAYDDLADLALMSGAELMADMRGRPLERLASGSFGRARTVLLTREYLTVMGGAGDKEAIRTRIGELRGFSNRLKREDAQWKQTRQRIAKLSGGVGILKIGAHTARERDLKKEQATKALQVLEAALIEGVVPGGGVAYLACIPVVRQLQQQEPNDQIAQGMALVAEALAAPFLQIVRNHGGMHPPIALAEVQQRGPGHGFDAIVGDYADMRASGVVDCLRIARSALESAASAAAMVLTTGVVVLSSAKKRNMSMRP